jgi:hypothetical protein
MTISFRFGSLKDQQEGLSVAKIICWDDRRFKHLASDNRKSAAYSAGDPQKKEAGRLVP